MKRRYRFKDWPLSAKLAVLLIVVSALPLVIVAAIDIRETQQRLLADATALLAARGDHLASQIDVFNVGYQRAARKLAHVPEVIAYCKASTDEADRLTLSLRAFLEVHPANDPGIRGVAILDLSGNVKITTEDGLIGKNLTTYDYVRQALSGVAVISDIYVAEPEIADALTIAYAAPVQDQDDKLIGVAVLWIRASALWDVAEASNELAGAGSFAVIFNQQGIRIAHTFARNIAFRPAGALDPELIDALVKERRFGAQTRALLEEDVRAFPELFDRARAASPDEGLFRGFALVNQQSNYGVGRRLKTAPWTAFYMVPEKSLNASIEKVARDRAILVAMAILAALILGALFAASILGPVRSLARATAALAAGDLEARVRDPTRVDEIGRLSTSFNDMADRIQTQSAALHAANDELETRVEQRTSELRESEQSLATTLDSIGDAVIATDVQGRVVRMNRVAEHLTGWPLEDAQGQPLDKVFHIIAEETRQRAEDPATRVLREGLIVGLANHTALIARDGSERPIADSGAPIRDAQDRIRGVVLVFRDQTEERKMEQMRVESLQLEVQNRQIQEGSRLKSEFLANMSHELRTPLNAIIGFTELLHDGRVNPESPQYHEFLGHILTSGRHLLQLINDVLDLSKVEAGKLQFHPESVDLSALVSEVLDILLTTAATKQIRIESTIDPALTDIVLDAARFKQVLYNYISNALKFTSEGGHIVISLRPEPGDDAAFRLEVQDTGIGIRAEDLHRLFVEFQQLDAGATKRYSGSGLGLALTKRLVEIQGGTVGVRSTPGQGSIFNAVLPRRVGIGQPLPTPRSFGGAHAHAPAVLVIEDSEHDQAILVRTLTEAGYAVDTAATGAQALAKCRERSFDAITLDLLLPDMGGTEVLRDIRAIAANRDVPVIVITVINDEGIVAGFAVHDLLRKPIDSVLLLESLKRAGVPPQRSGIILVVDDDLGSLQLMAATLTRLGYDVKSVQRGEDGLRIAEQMPPRAVVLDLLMPEMDGFRFLNLFRQIPRCRRVPVIIWTVKDLGAEEYAQLRMTVQGIVGKGREGSAAVVNQLQMFIPLDRPIDA